MLTNEANAIIRAIKEKETYVAFGFEKITVTDSTVSSLTIPEGTIYAEIQAESLNSGSVMRFLMIGDEVLPTSENGIFLTHGSFFDINNSDNLKNFRVISISGTHNLNVQYYKGA